MFLVHRCVRLLQVEALCEAQNIKLPADMLEVAAKYGLRASVLSAYISAAVSSAALHRLGGGLLGRIFNMEAALHSKACLACQGRGVHYTAQADWQVPYDAFELLLLLIAEWWAADQLDCTQHPLPA
jgi:hypothetical protein